MVFWSVVPTTFVKNLPLLEYKSDICYFTIIVVTVVALGIVVPVVTVVTVLTVVTVVTVVTVLTKKSCHEKIL